MTPVRPRRRREPSDELLGRTRVSLIRNARLVLAGAEEDVLIIDVGFGGAFVERSELLPIGSTLALRFLLPGNELPLEVQARVAWHHARRQPLVSKRLPPGMGLEFVAMDDDTRRRLRAFLVEHHRRAPRARQFAGAWPTPGSLARPAGPTASPAPPAVPEVPAGEAGPAIPGRAFDPQDDEPPSRPSS